MEKFIDNIVFIYDKNLNLSDRDKAILKYGVTIAISTISGYIGSLALAYLLGNFFSVLILILSMTLYRGLSGGAHCSTMIRCTIFSSILVNLICIVSKYILGLNFTPCIYFIMEFMILLYSIWALYNYAPADTEEKPINNREKREKLKKLSFVYIIVWYCFNIFWFYIRKNVNEISFHISMGILWQTFSITPLGYKFLNVIDKLFSLINIKNNVRGN